MSGARPIKMSYTRDQVTLAGFFGSANLRKLKKFLSERRFKA